MRGEGAQTGVFFVSVCAHALMYLLEPHVRFFYLSLYSCLPSDAWLIAALESHHGDVTA